jgi:hypothetical protein
MFPSAPQNHLYPFMPIVQYGNEHTTIASKILQGIQGNLNAVGPNVGSHTQHILHRLTIEGDLLNPAVSMLNEACKDFFLTALLEGELKTASSIGYRLVEFIVESQPLPIVEAYASLYQSLGFPMEQASSLYNSVWKLILREAINQVHKISLLRVVIY